MRRIFICLSILLTLTLTSFADVLSECYKIYPKDADTLFMNTLSALNSESKISVLEMQSQNGYILFTYGTKYYLLTITKRYQNQSEVKVLPQNSNYSQGSEIAQYVFSLIDATFTNYPMRLVK